MPQLEQKDSEPVVSQARLSIQLSLRLLVYAIMTLSPFPIAIAAVGLQLLTDFFDPNANGGFMLDNGELDLFLGLTCL